MMFKKLFAASICMAVVLGGTSHAFTPDSATRGQELDPNFKGTINVDVIDNNNQAFSDRMQSEMVEKPSPQVGQTRAAIEALYGPAIPSLAPNKEYEVYTNEWDLTDGKMFNRKFSHDALRIYEISYNAGALKSPNDTATDVKLRIVPRIGDHKNLITKMLGEPINAVSSQAGQHSVYGIPKHRYVFYNDVLSSPFEAINMYFNAEGYLVGQEFMPRGNQGNYVLTSTGRYVEVESKFQPDRKVGW